MNAVMRIMSFFAAVAFSAMLLFVGTLVVNAPVLAESSPAFAKSSEALLGKYPAGRPYKGRPSAVVLRSHKDLPNPLACSGK